MLRKLVALFSLATLLLTTAAGCSPTATGDASNQTQTMDKVTFQLNWLPEDPIYWAALDKGFWAEENLDVTIIKGQGSGDTITRMGMKQAEFALADIGPAIFGRVQDDIKLKAVANYQTFFPAAVLYHKDRGINTPKDLEGKTIITSPTSAWTLFFPAFAKAAGIDESKIIWEYVDNAILEVAFVKGDVDAYLSDIEAIPATEEMLGDSIPYFVYRDYGDLDRYSQCILVHDDYLQENPDVVRRFVKGFIRGVQYCLEHPEEVGAIVKKYVPEIDEAQTIEAWRVANENGIYCSDESRAKGLGWMDRERMAKTIDLVLYAYDIDKMLAPEEIFTTEFLPQDPIYPPLD